MQLTLLRRMKFAWLPLLVVVVGSVITFGPPYPVRTPSIENLGWALYFLCPYGIYLWLSFMTKRKLAINIAGMVMLVVDADAHYYVATGQGEAWKLMFWPPQLVALFFATFGVGVLIGMVYGRFRVRKTESESDSADAEGGKKPDGHPE